MLLPFSATLQKQYRDTLETVSAPTEIDTASPVVPVAVVAQVNTTTSAGYTRITDGTDIALVDTDGALVVRTLPEPHTGQTIITKYLAGNGANQNIHTVAAGKTFYLMGFCISNTSGAINSGIIKDNAGTQILRLDSSANYKSESVNGGGCPIAVYTAGQNVIFNAVAGIFGTVWGYEV